MIRKSMIVMWIVQLVLLSLVACQDASSTVTSTVAQAAGVVETGGMATGEEVGILASADVSGQGSAAAALADKEAVLVDVSDTTADLGKATTIALADGATSVSGEGAAVSGNTVTVTGAGTFIISGALTDGQIIVDTADDASMTLVLNGVTVHSSTSAPLYIRKADNVTLTLEDGTENALSDGDAYILEDPTSDEPNAALFSAVNLTINGGGLLTVTGNYNDGIASKDTLLIESGTIVVNAADDGIRGKDSLVIRDGALTIEAGGDGLKADNEEDATLGYVAVEDGTLVLTAGGDAIAAQTDILITGGTFSLRSGGGSNGQIGADESAKSLKGGASVFIDGGTFTIDSADDAIHANTDVTINDGAFTLSSGDDAVHADAALTLNSGDIDIVTSYEGLESALMTINGGTVDLVASDDGINVANGVDGSGAAAGPGMGGGPRPGGGPGMGSAAGQTVATYTGSNYLYLNGGMITVDAAGDGIDVNGAIVMTGGEVFVSGPTEPMNGSLDYDGGFQLNGGTLAAAGSAGMAMAPDTSSSQNSVLIYFGSAIPGGTEVQIQDSAGQSVLTFTPAKAYESLAFSSATLTTGETYNVLIGGESYGEFAVSSVVTQVGQGARP